MKKMTKKQLAMAVTLTLALGFNFGLPTRGYTSAGTSTFENFANKAQLEAKADEYRTKEYNNSTGLEPLNAARAYALGYSGEGITLGEVDTPVYYNHKDLKGKVNLYGYNNAFFNRAHGTHVAGIMVAAKNDDGMHGIAYNANLEAAGMKENTLLQCMQTFSDNVPRLSNSRSINNSWAASSYSNLDNMSFEAFGQEFGQEINENSESWDYYNLVNTINSAISVNDKIIVFAASNDGHRMPDQGTSGLGKIDEFSNNYVSAISTCDNTISVFSNLAGNSNKYAVLAPGSDIRSLNDQSPTDAYNEVFFKTALKSGTSMAAPYVTGTTALIQEAMPYLSSKQVLDALFTTCDSSFLNRDNKEDQYIVTVYIYEVNEKKRLDGIYITYYDRAIPSSSNTIDNDLLKYYDSNEEFQDYLKAVGVNKKNLIQKFNEFGRDVATVSKREIIGYGLVDAGRAVQGPAALDASRLSTSDLSTMYNAQKKNEYIYSVNTGKASDNYQHRKYSIWSNNIEQWNDVNSCNVGLLKTGEVDLYLLGDNTYKGPTVVNGGKLQIVKGVEGDVFANGLNGYAEAVVNGKAGAVYAMPNSGVKITDSIVKGRDFLSEALPKTTQVAINGGLFSAGMENNLSVINVELSNPKSTITGPLYQNAFGQVNVRLDSGATYNIQQGSGYYNTNTFVGNNCMNWLTLFGGNVSLKDSKYSALAVNYLSGYNGVFALDSDLKNGIGDKLIINATPLGLNSGPHYLNVYDKSGYIDTSSGRALLLAVAPNVVDLSGLNVDYGTYKYTPQFLNKTSGDNKKWYFIGYSNNGTTYTGPLYKGEFTYLENANVTNSGMFTDGLYYNSGAGNNKISIMDVGTCISSDHVKSYSNGTDKVIINFNNKKDYGIIDKLYFDKELEINLTGFNHNDYAVKGLESDKQLIVNIANGGSAILVDNDHYVCKGDTVINSSSDYRDSAGMVINGESIVDTDFYFNQADVTYGGKALFFNKDLKKGNIQFNGDINITSKGVYDIRGIVNSDRYDSYTNTVVINGDINIDSIKSSSSKEAYIQTAIDNERGNLIVNGNVNLNMNSDGIGNINELSIEGEGQITINGNLYGNCVTLSTTSLVVNGDVYTEYDNLCQDRRYHYTNWVSDFKADNAYLYSPGSETFSFNQLQIANNLSCNSLTIYYNLDYPDKDNSYVNGVCSVDDLKLTGVNCNFNQLNSANNINISTSSYKNKKSVVTANNIKCGGDISVTNSDLAAENVECNLIKLNNRDSGAMIINKGKNGTVKINGPIENLNTTTSTNEATSIFNFTNADSYLKGSLTWRNNTPITLEFSNGAKWDYAFTGYNNNNIDLVVNNQGKVTIPYVYMANNTNSVVRSLKGYDGILNFEIQQSDTERNKMLSGNSSQLAFSYLKVLNNEEPEPSKHYITFTPSYDSYCSDFFIKEGAQIWAKKLIDYGTYGNPAEHFEVLPFDAGAYKYTPVVEYGAHTVTLTGIVPYGSSLSVVNKANETDQQYDYSGENRVVTTINKVENSTITGGSVLNIVAVKGGSNNQISGGSQADVFRIKGSEQLVSGGAGDDIITIKGGNADIVSGGAGNDRYAFSSLSAKGEYLVDQSTAGAKDRDSVSLAGYSKNDFTFSRNYEGDLVIAQKGADGAVIYVKGWDEHALNNIAFADGQMKAAELTALAGEIPEEPKDLWDTLTAAGEDSLSEEKNASDKQVVSQGDPVLSNLAHNVHKTAINNAVNFRNEYNNLRKRLGDLHLSKEEEGIWARNFHGRQESSKYGFSGSHTGFQLGFDRSVTRKDGDKWLYGVAATSYQGKNSLSTGKVENKSVGGAMYGTYLGGKGHYLDLVARHSRQSNDLTSFAEGSGQRLTGEYHNWGTSVSAEYGRRIDLKKGFYLQPEAELIYGHVNKASYTLSDESKVKQNGLNSVTGRMGLSIGKSTKKGSFAVSANYVHDFGDTTSSTISDKYGKSHTQKHNTKDSWLELDLSGNIKLGNKTYLYGDMEKSFGGDIKTKWRYNLGVRYSF